MRTIVKLHGTSGAGKSFVAHQLLKAFPENRMSLTFDGKEEAQVIYCGLSTPLYILGKYNTTCGGCDALHASVQIELLHKYAALGHVLYEGLLASEYYGKLGEASEKYGANHIFAFLDTPIETCIERIMRRRRAAGNTKPLNEDNTRGRVRKIAMLQAKLSRMGRTVVSIDHRDSVAQVFKLFESGDGMPQHLTNMYDNARCTR